MPMNIANIWRVQAPCSIAICSPATAQEPRIAALRGSTAATEVRPVLPNGWQMC